MPTRKQRRRRRKERRHEWEEVYVDESGREIDPDDVDEIESETRTRENGRRPVQARGRSARTVDPPSWRRVAKRGLIFAPFMFIVISVLDPSTGIPARVLYTLQLMLLFVPFSYLVDTISYRVYQKRTQQPDRRSSRG